MKSARIHSFDEVCAALVQEPFNLTPSQIALLTPYQVRHHYFRPKEEDSPSGPSQLTPRQLFWRALKDWKGLPEEEVQRRWEEERRRDHGPQ